MGGSAAPDVANWIDTLGAQRLEVAPAAAGDAAREIAAGLWQPRGPDSPYRTLAACVAAENALAAASPRAERRDRAPRTNTTTPINGRCALIVGVYRGSVS